MADPETEHCADCNLTDDDLAGDHGACLWDYTQDGQTALLCPECMGKRIGPDPPGSKWVVG